MLLNASGCVCCVMCGNQIVRKPHRSAVSLRSVQDFLSTQCVKTGFHYASVMQIPFEGRMAGICSACRGWRRRVSKRAGTRQRHLTPFNSVVKVVLSPGASPDLDQRNWHSVRCGVMHPDNLFADILPVPVRSILATMLQADPEADHRRELARAWFEYN